MKKTIAFFAVTLALALATSLRAQQAFWGVNYSSSGGRSGTPSFSPGAGTYTGTQSVTISATGGSVICYNTTGSPATNGSTGCTTGTLYTGAVSVSTSETLYAVSGGTGYTDSSVGSAAYTISVPSGTYLVTSFNEASSGTNLAGTTPATCANGCVGPWSISSGTTDFTYQSGGGISTTAAPSSIDVIDTGNENETVRFNISACTGTCYVGMRFTDVGDCIWVVIQSGTFKIQEVVSGSYNTIFNSVYGGTGLYTFVFTGSNFTGTNGSVSTGTLSTSNTGTKFGLQNASGTMSLSSLSAKST
jgi:hypothetical protein